MPFCYGTPFHVSFCEHRLRCMLLPMVYRLIYGRRKSTQQIVAQLDPLNRMQRLRALGGDTFTEREGESTTGLAHLVSVPEERTLSREQHRRRRNWLYGRFGRVPFDSTATFAWQPICEVG